MRKQSQPSELEHAITNVDHPYCSILLQQEMHAVHGVTKSWTRLSDFTVTFHFHALEKEMATHYSVLAWRIPRDRGAWWAAVYGVAQSQT